jgi:hypothetical protein
MTATLTKAELTAMGMEVRDGRAVRVGSGDKGNNNPVEKPTRNRGGAAALTQNPSPTASPYRSKWEAERATALFLTQVAGEIADWRYEGLKLRLADGAWYKPDFVVRHNDGGIELEEVKGYWREAAKVRWKVAVEQYSAFFDFSLWTKQGGKWVRVEYHGRAA